VLEHLIAVLFGSCRHKHCTFPITGRAARAGNLLSRCTYVVCLDCGKQFPYDWEQMKVIWTPLNQPHYSDEPLVRPRWLELLLRLRHALKKSKPRPV
jgi:hypothetical protein